MYSAFEAWMVTEFHQRGLDQSLSEMFGTMTFSSGVVAIISGVFSEQLVEFIGSKKAPFMASTLLLCAAFWAICTLWVAFALPHYHCR